MSIEWKKVEVYTKHKLPKYFRIFSNIQTNKQNKRNNPKAYAICYLSSCFHLNLEKDRILDTNVIFLVFHPCKKDTLSVSNKHNLRKVKPPKYCTWCNIIKLNNLFSRRQYNIISVFVSDVKEFQIKFFLMKFVLT